MLRIKDLPGHIVKDYALRIVVLLDLLVFQPPNYHYVFWQTIGARRVSNLRWFFWVAVLVLQAPRGVDPIKQQLTFRVQSALRGTAGTDKQSGAQGMRSLVCQEVINMLCKRGTTTCNAVGVWSGNCRNL
jgi:hypothetical protein